MHHERTPLPVWIGAKGQVTPASRVITRRAVNSGPLRDCVVHVAVSQNSAASHHVGALETPSTVA